MTQQEALYYAISVIKQQPETKAGNNAIEVLSNMTKSCRYIKWTEETVRQALDDWKAEHNRNPSVTDLSEPEMPKGTTIKKLFDMSPSAFLNIYYPREHPKKSVSKYNLLTEEDYKNIFIKQYQKHKPTSARKYDSLRDKGTPAWTTIILHCGLKTWEELIQFSGVKRYSKISKTYQPREYTVISHNPTYEKLVKLLEEQKEDLAKITKIKL